MIRPAGSTNSPQQILSTTSRAAWTSTRIWTRIITLVTEPPGYPESEMDRYKAIWAATEPAGAAVCGQEILPDHEIELVERHLGDGWKLKNLVYIHCDCRYDALRNIGTSPSDGIDLMDRLSGFLHDTPPEKSPYYELREFFRLSEQTPISLTFEQIEEILGDPLDWEAYFTPPSGTMSSQATPLPVEPGGLSVPHVYTNNNGLLHFGGMAQSRVHY